MAFSSSLLAPRPSPASLFVQQEAPLSSPPAGQRGGQRGHRESLVLPDGGQDGAGAQLQM